MATTKIRLQRHGRKGYAFYHVVVADSTAPRDGKYIERLGSYNPNTNPATVEINFERALYWVKVGAQPTDTVRNILSNEGVYLRKHLDGGVAKGAFDETEAQKKFDTWKADKENKLNKIKESAEKKQEASKKERQTAEEAVNKAKAEVVAKKKEAAAKAKAEEEAKAAAEVAEPEPAATEPAAAPEESK